MRGSSGIPLAPWPSGALADIESMLAVGCPVVNLAVIAAIGASGALNVWAPIQMLTVYGHTLDGRCGGARRCCVRARSALAACRQAGTNSVVGGTIMGIRPLTT